MRPAPHVCPRRCLAGWQTRPANHRWHSAAPVQQQRRSNSAGWQCSRAIQQGPVCRRPTIESLQECYKAFAVLPQEIRLSALAGLRWGSKIAVGPAPAERHWKPDQFCQAVRPLLRQNPLDHAGQISITDLARRNARHGAVGAVHTLGSVPDGLLQFVRRAGLALLLFRDVFNRWPRSSLVEFVARRTAALLQY